MTKNNITGIDIRKALLAAGLRPSNYDEQAIYNYLQETPLELEDISTFAQDHFNVDKSLNKPADYDLYN